MPNQNNEISQVNEIDADRHESMREFGNVPFVPDSDMDLIFANAVLDSNLSE